MRHIRMPKQPKDSSYCMATCVAAIMGNDLDKVIKDVGDRYLEIAPEDHYAGLKLIESYMVGNNINMTLTQSPLVNTAGYWICSVPSLNVPNCQHAVVLQVENINGQLTGIVHDPQAGTGRFYYGNEFQADADMGFCRRLSHHNLIPLFYIDHASFKRGPILPGK